MHGHRDTWKRDLEKNRDSTQQVADMDQILFRQGANAEPDQVSRISNCIGHTLLKYWQHCQICTTANKQGQLQRQRSKYAWKRESVIVMWGQLAGFTYVLAAVGKCRRQYKTQTAMLHVVRKHVITQLFTLTTQSAFCVNRFNVSSELYGCTTTSEISSWFGNTEYVWISFFGNLWPSSTTTTPLPFINKLLTQDACNT